MTELSSARGARQLVACCGAMLFVLAVAAAAQAQDVIPELSASLVQELVPVPPVTPDVPDQTDARDLLKHLHHKLPADGDGVAAAAASRKPFVVFAPTISSKPSTGLTLGVGATIAFFAGDPSTTHLSSVSTGGRVSMKEQALTGVRFASFTSDDRWFLQGDNRFQWTSLNTYALGAGSTAASGSRLNYDYFRVYETTYRQIARRLFVGAGLNFSNHTNVTANDEASVPVELTEYSAYSQRHGFDLDGQKSGGTNVGLLYDTRDNSINASRGWLVSGNFRTFFGGFLGGDSTWQELYTDVRTYRKLTRSGRQKLAFWFLGDLVTGGTAPYFDLPTTGGDGRSARGYAEGRYRGPHLLYGEIEYRGTVTSNGLLGVVAFLNTTTVDNDTGQKLFQSFAPGAGVGGRVLLDKRSRTNFCFDFGWGRDGSRGLYLSLQEAF